MRISYNWLKDYVDIKVPPEKLAELLTMAGLSVDSIDETGGDFVLEAEVTSNRPDWLSYIGVAREVAALTGRKLKLPSLVIRRSSIVKNKRTTNNEQRTTIIIADKLLCPRYTARIIRDIKVAESPKWLKEKIEAVGLRSVNNVVDITNFCLLETGEPMHAFDLDKLSGHSIVVRRASKGEKIITIDGVERSLDDNMLVIADDKSPAAIAGVMGGAHAEVGLATKNILLEVAYFDPTSIRKTSRKLALSTESSYRFERGVDMENIKYASDRATQLISKLACARAGEFIDIGKARPGKKNISLRLDRLNKIIGIEIPPSRVKAILMSLGLKVKSSSNNVLKLNAPGFRNDLQDEIDIIEEAARIYGYDNIPETIPPVVGAGKRLPLEMAVDKNIRDILINLGLFEIITYSLLSRKALTSLAKLPDSSVIEVINPLSNEQEVMRPTLVAGMLNAICWNMNRKMKDLKLFELGRAYFKETGGSFVEKKYLTIAVAGQLHDGWIGRSRAVTLFDLKGILETLFQSMGIKNYCVKESQNNLFSPAACACIETDAIAVGMMGQIDPKVLDNFDIKEVVYAAEIDYSKLLKYISSGIRFKEIPKFPSVKRDISIVTDINISNIRIVSLIKETAGDLLKDVELIDRYSGGQIPDGKIGLTYRLEYRDLKRTLQDSDLQGVHLGIINALENNLGAKLR
ncbi:MAG: phenylalanine--tRNA ligase subunit beta [Candidatus Omnitrophota bacterium]|nr:phenylalanine--tRNA ligase subunit beta [Candidatus Omnitrophota bacterium]